MMNAAIKFVAHADLFDALQHKLPVGCDVAYDCVTQMATIRASLLLGLRNGLFETAARDSRSTVLFHDGSKMPMYKWYCKHHTKHDELARKSTGSVTWKPTAVPTIR